MTREIEITVPTDSDYWGPEATEVEARRAAEVQLNLLTQWAEQQWPGARISGRLVDEVTSWGNRTCATPDPGGEVVGAIEQRHSETWMQALEAMVR